MEEIKGADFSNDKRLRYKLWRTWDDSLPKAMCIGLNPSTANSDDNDPTIDNLKRALIKLGFGGLVMVNCFPIVSSDPKILKSIDINDLDNEANQYIIQDVAEHCDEVIFAWGSFKEIDETGINKRYEELFPYAKCFGKTKKGKPFHPLYLMWSGKIKNPELINYFQ